MKRSYSGYLYIVLCAVIFSTMEVMLKTVHGVFAPMQITCLRFLIGGILLIPFALRSMKKKGAAFTRADVGFFALTGFLCVAFSMVLYQMAVTHTKASVVAVIFSCNPIFVTVLASLLLHERIRRNHIIALALELLAVLIIIDPLHASLDPTGALLAIASALVFSFYSVVGKKRTPRFGGIAVTCFSFLFGSVELLAVLLLGRTAAVGGLFASLGLDIFVNVPLFSGIPLSALPAPRLHLRGQFGGRLRLPHDGAGEDQRAGGVSHLLPQADDRAALRVSLPARGDHGEYAPRHRLLPRRLRHCHPAGPDRAEKAARLTHSVKKCRYRTIAAFFLFNPLRSGRPRGAQSSSPARCAAAAW